MSDIISRQDAVDALKKIMFTHLFECGEYIGEDTREISIMNAEKALDVMLDEVPSAEPERRWIPVSEALPKVRTDVLLAFEKNMAVGFYSHGCWNVNTGNGFYTGVFTDEDKPIAWMPLPEPWKGE